MANNIILPGSGSGARGGSGAVSATGAAASASAATPTASASIGSSSAASASSAAGGSGTSVALSIRSALAVLCGGKVARVAAAFATFRFLRGADGSPLFFYLFCVVAGASAVLLSLQRPWTGRRIGAKRWRKIAASGAMLAATLCAWVAGVKSCGPLRALLVDGAELPLLYASSIIRRRELPERRKTRGALLMLAAYALLVYDASGRAPGLADIEESPLVHRAGEQVGALRHKTAEELARLSAAAARARGEQQPPEQLTVRRRLLADDGASSAAAAVGAIAPMTALRPLVATDGSLASRLLGGVDGLARGSSATLQRLARVHFRGVATGERAPLVPPRRRLHSLFDSDIDGDGSGDGFFPRAPRRRLGGACRVGGPPGPPRVGVDASIAAAHPPVGDGARRLQAPILPQRHRRRWRRVGVCHCRCLGLLPWPGHPRVASTTSVLSMVQYATVGILWLVAPYYIRALVAPVLSQRTLLRVGVSCPSCWPPPRTWRRGGEGGGLVSAAGHCLLHGRRGDGLDGRRHPEQETTVGPPGGL
eukprot:TRINITY_DN1723_c0_g1_i3.p1 TRINITY_DN1723_c0_g1~~TRINITY_DN1723_c0_g1_i3.p1  ORF type:complete len:537 (-),score=137.93 TRINITY_DN1723_c0_g1_i3:325-1935(-)